MHENGELIRNCVMNVSKFLFGVSCMLSVCFAQYDVKKSFQPSKSYVYDLVAEFKTQAALPFKSGGLMPIEGDFGLSYTRKVEAQKETLAFKTTIDSLKMNAGFQGFSFVNVDSSSPEFDRGPLARLTKPLLEAELTSYYMPDLTYIKSDRISNFEVLEKLKVEQSLVEMFFRQGLDVLPPKPVKEGDTWSKKLTLFIEKKPYEITLYCKCGAVEMLEGHSCQRFFYSSDLNVETNHQGKEISLKSKKYQGFCWYDPKFNLLRKYTLDLNVALEMRHKGQIITRSYEISSKTNLKSVK